MNYEVSPLEGLWWADDMATFSTAQKAGWRWTMMIAQPDEVTPELFQAVANLLRGKKTLPALEHVRLDTRGTASSADPPSRAVSGRGADH